MGESDGFWISDRVSEAQLRWMRENAPDLLVDDDKNFRTWKPNANPPDPLASDPKAEHRRTQKLLRHVLMRKAFRAYMAWAPKGRRKAARAILKSWISQGWAKGKGFERTIRRIRKAQETRKAKTARPLAPFTMTREAEAKAKAFKAREAEVKAIAKARFSAFTVIGSWLSLRAKK
jgi:hypothetical protein